MRGSRTLRSDRSSLPGIIPAHAGLTGTEFVLRPAGRDHPRACGAHTEPDAPVRASAGSSPRMRGSRIQEIEGEQLAGIIPAHAGLTTRMLGAASARGDHPRACGAHTRTSSRHAREVGSSPRMRGSHVNPHARFSAVGIIPAHAGLTNHPPHQSQVSWDHPRACGAHQITTTLRRAAMGSSPRMRGSPPS